jgi:hypothetical protein
VSVTSSSSPAATGANQTGRADRADAAGRSRNGSIP